MVKKTFTNLRGWLDHKLHHVCERLSKDTRIVIIVIFIIGGSILSIYWTISSIYNMGKKSVEKDFMEIKHIERLKLQRKDNIKQYQLKEYGTKSEFE